MPRPPHISRQTVAVLRALAASPSEWRYGLSLARETGLKSGTLYPILVRLADDGFLESRWLPVEQPGRPPRHAYRLTARGRALAAARDAAVAPIAGPATA